MNGVNLELHFKKVIRKWKMFSSRRNLVMESEGSDHPGK